MVIRRTDEPKLAAAAALDAIVVVAATVFVSAARPCRRRLIDARGDRGHARANRRCRCCLAKPAQVDRYRRYCYCLGNRSSSPHGAFLA